VSEGSAEGSKVSERSIRSVEGSEVSTEGSEVSERSVEGYSVGRDRRRVPDTQPTASKH